MPVCCRISHKTELLSASVRKEKAHWIIYLENILKSKREEMCRHEVLPETMEVLFSGGWPYATQDIAE